MTKLEANMKNLSTKTTNKSLKYVTILGVKVSSTPKGELLTLIQKKLSEKMQFYIVTPNPEIILQAQSDPNLFTSLNSADFSIPDGVGLRLADKDLEIIKGRDFIVDLFKIANEKKLKVYLLGSTLNTNRKAQARLKSEYPNILVSGNSGPKLNKDANPVSEVDTSIQFEIFDEINKFKPDFLFVAFGAPKQEKWIFKNFKIQMPNVKCAMAVGGSLDYFTGFVKSVPEWIESIGLEWLWRLIQEPKRIRRIFNALIVFPSKLVIDKFSQNINTE